MKGLIDIYTTLFRTDLAVQRLLVVLHLLEELLPPHELRLGPGVRAHSF